MSSEYRTRSLVWHRVLKFVVIIGCNVFVRVFFFRYFFRSFVFVAARTDDTHTD